MDKMDNIPVPSLTRDFARRGSNTSIHSATPPKSPIFFTVAGGIGTTLGVSPVARPPVSPGAFSNMSNVSNGSGGHGDGGGGGGAGSFTRRFVFGAASPSKKVCTMDCPSCRQMARQIREQDGPASVSPYEFASAPVSRKSSGGIGERETEYEGEVTPPGEKAS